MQPFSGNGLEELTKVILENKAANFPNHRNETILFLLAKHNDSGEALDLLLDHVDIDSVNGRGQTALGVAVEHNAINATLTLIQVWSTYSYKFSCQVSGKT